MQCVCQLHQYLCQTERNTTAFLKQKGWPWQDVGPEAAARLGTHRGVHYRAEKLMLSLQLWLNFMSCRKMPAYGQE